MKLRIITAVFIYLGSSLPFSSAQAGDKNPQVLRGWLNEYTAHIENKVSSQYSGLLEIPAKRMKNLCPRWEDLESKKRIQFWSALLWSVARWESDYLRTAIHKETGMGNDAVTHRMVRSEGLLQVSYGDLKTYQYPGGDISWEKDRELATDDYDDDVKQGNSARTILNAYANINLGLWVISQNVDKYPDGTLESALLHYWATLNPRKKLYPKVVNGLKEKIPTCFLEQ